MKPKRKARTLEELWRDAEPFGIYKDRPGKFDESFARLFGEYSPTEYEIRRRPSGALIAKITSGMHRYPEFRRMRRIELSGFSSGGHFYEPSIIPVSGATSGLERRRRLRDLHPDRLGREQTPSEREEYARVARGWM